MYKKPCTEQLNVQPATIIATSIIIGGKSTSEITPEVPKVFAD